MPSISVVITCYLEGNLIYEAVNSVLSQSVCPQEIIVVNDASPDDITIKVCQELELKKETNCPIKVVWREENGGSAVARNTGFLMAKGEILVPLDADDILPAGALKLISAAFDHDPSLSFVYGGYVRQNAAETEGMIINPGDISLTEMLRARIFSLSSNWKLLGTTPLKREFWLSLGGYDPNFGIKDLHDVEFWIRAIASGGKYTNIADVIYIWRKYLGSNSRLVTPLAWRQIAEKFFDIYQKNDLEYRAYQLLILGDKWQNRDVSVYRHNLWQTMLSGKLHFSSIITLIISFLPERILVFWASRRRR